uniref:Adenosine deaminase n=1 Tax=Latimeria chalumnae TaxID=7897 RepID=H3AI59_LATCH
MIKVKERTSCKYNEPKVELHLHLDGAIRLQTIIDVARQRKIQLEAKNVDQLAKFVTCEKPSSLTEVLAKFSQYMYVIAGDREAIKTIAHDLVEDKAKEGVIYFEARYSPHLLANSMVDPIPWNQEQGDLTPSDVVHLVNEGFKKGEQDFGVKVRSILCCMRHMPVQTMTLNKRCNHLLSTNDPVLKTIWIDTAKLPMQKCGSFPTTKKLLTSPASASTHKKMHAHILKDFTKVRNAIELLKAERIGHGYRTLEDQELYKELLKKKIHFETCPISSRLTGACKPDFTKHPVIRLKEDKANFSLNTDDPLIFQSTLYTDYEVAEKYMNFTEEDFMKVNLNAARSCFLPPEEKEELIRKLCLSYGVEGRFST